MPVVTQNLDVLPSASKFWRHRMAAHTPKQPSGFGESKSRYAGPRSEGARAKPARLRLPGPEALPDGTVPYALLLGPKGRVLFPADLRNAIGLDPADVFTPCRSARPR